MSCFISNGISCKAITGSPPNNPIVAATLLGKSPACNASSSCDWLIRSKISGAESVASTM